VILHEKTHRFANVHFRRGVVKIFKEPLGTNRMF
jgi:hypothetical protein